MTSVRQEPRPARDPTPPKLGVLRVLFDRLHAEGIRYCHWKSNEHLDASLVGDTDVDVLVDRRAIVPLTRMLAETNFKRFVVRPGLGYPGIEDYVGFDPETGALTHLHVHYQLTLGEKFLKGHRLPWEELYLSTRVLDESRGLYVADPHLELVVLVLRAAMKVRARDFLIEGLGKPYFRGGLLREFRWLSSRVRQEQVAGLATRLVGARAGALFPAILAAGGPSLRQLVAIRRSADPSLQEYRLYAGWQATRGTLGRELSIVWWKLKNWYLAAPTKSTRTLPQGGLLIEFLGADGAGKSTVAAEIAAWLAHEVAVTSTPGGNSTTSAARPRRVMRWLDPLRPGARTGQRRRRARDARRARGKGMVVLSDPGSNDGPWLDAWVDHPSRWRRAAARRERESFRLADLCPPDLVIKLHVSPELAGRRKPATPRDPVTTGVKFVPRRSYPATTRVVDIDASQPLEQVTLQVKRAVWEAI